MLSVIKRNSMVDGIEDGIEFIDRSISSAGGCTSSINPSATDTSRLKAEEEEGEEEEDRCLFDSMLPEELRIYIFNFLNLKSLIQAALVSTEWKRLTNDPSLWHSHYLYRWGNDYYPSYQDNQSQISSTSSTSSTSNGNYPNTHYYQLGSAIDWKDSVKTRYLLDRNWTVGDCYASTLRGHTGWVTCIDMHNNRLVSCSYDGTVRVWNTQTGNSLQSFPSNHQDGLSPVWCVQFKGNTIMAGSSDSLVRQWNMATAQCVKAFNGHAGGVKCIQVPLLLFSSLSFFPSFLPFFPSFPSFLLPSPFPVIYISFSLPPRPLLSHDEPSLLSPSFPSLLFPLPSPPLLSPPLLSPPLCLSSMECKFD